LLTQEGHEVWDIIQTCAAQVRVAPSGRVIGFDFAPMLAAVEMLGYCRQAFLSLINAAESGMLQGLREIQHDA
jgi:hypothetical protein